MRVLSMISVVSFGLLAVLASPGAHAEPVVLTDGDLAYRIENLEVNGNLYTVDFLWKIGDDVYGSPPTPVFDFPSESAAVEARNAVLDALNAYNDAVTIPPDELAEYTAPLGSVRTNFFRIAFGSESSGTQLLNVSGFYDSAIQTWKLGSFSSPVPCCGGETLWADFTTVAAAGVVSKTKACPGVAGVLPPGSRYELWEVILSADSPSQVQLYWSNPNSTIMDLYMDANETINVSFEGQVDSEEGNGLKLECSGTGNVSLTVRGRASL